MKALRRQSTQFPSVVAEWSPSVPQAFSLVQLLHVPLTALTRPPAPVYVATYRSMRPT